MSRFGLLQVPSGISGDMFLGALVDAGAPLAAIQEAIQAVTGDTITLASREVLRGGLRGTKVDVQWKGEVISESGGPGAGGEHPQTPTDPQRFSKIEERIEKAPLSLAIRTRSLDAFRRLAQAESKIHGVPVSDVHFHELGTLDALADVVGTVAGVESLDLGRLYHGTVAVGGGTVNTAHGELAVPAPATLALLEGRSCRFEEGRGELTTPTGAALLRTLAEEVPPGLDLVPEGVGYGAGTRDPKHVPNLARLLIGSPKTTSPRQGVAVIEASLDDCTPEEGGHLIGELLQAGALDVTLSPLIMKKGRPGFLLRVLAPSESGAEFAERVVRSSTSLGARWRVEERVELDRRIDRVRLPEGEVRVKVAILPDGSERPHPEYEDLAGIATSRGVPLSRVRAEVERVWAAKA